ncbi:hypothetical protein FSW04_12105 [Baekduia soli]|uniref:Thiamine pyrophosphate enzyme N-terminal TPP-binding domain-containing protein n=1 Tax=Baekduia soli TaxID=496014 RepID=A0A5B8U561_9ACTN|nr:thiamine pyrophosphate-binding protein [Baekduia soli]QEC48234.1 hypothetical protein FSW04_12105 [Baekduia soli]
MAHSTIAQFTLNRPADWGAKRIYGYPGDDINGLLGAFREVGDRVELTQVRDEEIAWSAACAHANKDVASEFVQVCTVPTCRSATAG